MRGEDNVRYTLPLSDLPEHTYTLVKCYFQRYTAWINPFLIEDSFLIVSGFDYPELPNDPQERQHLLKHIRSPQTGWMHNPPSLVKMRTAGAKDKSLMLDAVTMFELSQGLYTKPEEGHGHLGNTYLTQAYRSAALCAGSYACAALSVLLPRSDPQDRTWCQALQLAHRLATVILQIHHNRDDFPAATAMDLFANATLSVVFSRLVTLDQTKSSPQLSRERLLLCDDQEQLDPMRVGRLHEQNYRRLQAVAAVTPPSCNLLLSEVCALLEGNLPPETEVTASQFLSTLETIAYAWRACQKLGDPGLDDIFRN